MDLNLYDAFGNHLADVATATGNPETLIDPVGFGGVYGYYFDKETGKSLLGHRYYDSAYGRFLNRDPIGYTGGINLYGYAGNDPINESDPSGYAYPHSKAYWAQVQAADDAYRKANPNWERDTLGSLVGFYGGLAGAVDGTDAIVGLGALLREGGIVAAKDLAVETALQARAAALRAARQIGTKKTIAAAQVAKRLTIQELKAQGDAFRDEVANTLRNQGREVRTEVVKKTPIGDRRIDIEVGPEDDPLGGVETKLGNSRYHASQRAKDWYLRNIKNYPVNVIRRPRY
jgi:RHS repeat-associated protein